MDHLFSALKPFLDMAANIPADMPADKKVIWFAHRQITAGELRVLAEAAAEFVQTECMALEVEDVRVRA